MILKPSPYYSTDQFIWNKDTRTFSAEASDLHWPVGSLSGLGRVYDDACDVGFTLVSHKTGREIVMVHNDTDSDPDYSGGWRVVEFIPANLSERKLFAKVVVFND